MSDDEIQSYRWFQKWEHLPPDEPEPDHYANPATLIAVGMFVLCAALMTGFLGLAVWAKFWSGE